MEPEPSEHGRKLTLSGFLHALRSRGRDADADKYEHRFVTLLCPPLSREHVLGLAFEDLCAATSLLKQTTLFSQEASGLSVQSGQTVLGSDFRYGTWYLKKMGRSLKRAP